MKSFDISGVSLASVMKRTTKSLSSYDTTESLGDHTVEIGTFSTEMPQSRLVESLLHLRD